MEKYTGVRKISEELGSFQSPFTDVQKMISYRVLSGFYQTNYSSGNLLDVVVQQVKAEG